jgi:hypothetical protein
MKKHAYYEIDVGSGKLMTRLLVVFVGSCLGYPIINRVVFGSRVTIRLIIGSGSCQTRLCNRVSRVDTNRTREPELPTLNLIYTCFTCVFALAIDLSIIINRKLNKLINHQLRKQKELKHNYNYESSFLTVLELPYIHFHKTKVNSYIKWDKISTKYLLGIC